MKLRLIYALAIAGLLTTLSSCSNEDDPIVPGSSLEQKTYTGTDGLTLNFNGTPLLGKTATFTPASDGTATVTLAGQPVDMEEIMGMITKAEQPKPTLPTAGVLPGSPAVEIPVELKGDADNCTFSGTGETDYCTYSYSGSATAETFEFNLTDVKLKNTTLVGTWTLPELYEVDPDYPEFGASPNMYNVARVVWQSEKGIEVFPGWSMPIETIVGMTLAIPMIGDGDNMVSPVEMLTMVLKSVTFAEDGNVTAEYVDAKDMSKGVIKSPAGVAQYVITSEGRLRLFLNPAAIIANTVKATKGNSTRAADMSLIVENLMQHFIPMLLQGIPVKYGKAITDSEGNMNEDPNVMSFYLGTETLLPLLKAIAPLMSDEDFVNSIVEEASKDPNMGSMAAMLPAIFQALPEVIDTTTTIEIGINLKK